MIRIQNELLALEVFAEMIHAPDSGGGGQVRTGRRQGQASATDGWRSQGGGGSQTRAGEQAGETRPAADQGGRHGGGGRSPAGEWSVRLLLQLQDSRAPQSDPKGLYGDIILGENKS